MLVETQRGCGWSTATPTSRHLDTRPPGHVVISLTQQASVLCKSYGDRQREAALHNHLADLLHAANRSDEAMLHLKQAATIFAEISVEAGTLQPEIWKLSEW